MPVNFHLYKSKSKVIRPTFACGHVVAVKVSTDTSPAQVCLIEQECATQLCASCSTGKATSERNRARAK